MQITNKIRFNNLPGDIAGGVTAALVSRPLALAFGIAFFAALFGGTPTLISEPTGPMTVVMTAKDPENGLTIAVTGVMLASLFQIIFGVFKLGEYITLMPYSVIDTRDKGLQVFIVGATAKVKHRLAKLGVSELVSPENVLQARKVALQEGLDWICRQNQNITV